MHEYPEQIDCVWLATDRAGQVGAFITAGVGPIPNVLLDNYEFDIEVVEQSIIDLPRVGDVRLLVSVPRPDDFIAIAERGIFVYDWTDLHRTSDFRGAYEQVAVPQRPIQSTALTDKLVKMFGNVRFSNVEFSSSGLLDVVAHLPSQRGQY
jgi:hypothetical protein